MKVFAVAHLPEDKVQAWLQHMRDFDTHNPGCHFEVAIDDGPEIGLAEMVERLRIDPALTFTKIFERNATPQVHILRHGLPLCRFSGFPIDWPPGHRWVGEDKAVDATCSVCKERANG